MPLKTRVVQICLPAWNANVLLSKKRKKEKRKSQEGGTDLCSSTKALSLQMKDLLINSFFFSRNYQRFARKCENSLCLCIIPCMCICDQTKQRICWTLTKTTHCETQACLLPWIIPKLDQNHTLSTEEWTRDGMVRDIFFYASKWSKKYTAE